jgi:hypothetical protein
MILERSEIEKEIEEYSKVSGRRISQLEKVLDKWIKEIADEVLQDERNGHN